MNNRTLKNDGASIRARLLNRTRERGDDFQRTLTRYGIERLLFRLSQTDATESFVLKGAMLFATWPENALRPTGDLDLLGRGDPDTAVLEATFRRICEVQLPEDGIVFDPDSVRAEAVREADKYQGARLRLMGTLDGAAISVQVDIGFGDQIYPAPLRQEFPSLLHDLPTPRILMYPPETVIAEKFEAMIRFGETNGRVKDLYDMWLTSRTFPFEMGTLVEAVSGTLRRRDTPVPTDLPVGLTDAFARIVADRGLWTGFLRRTPPANEPPGFLDVLEELRHFFTPVIAALSAPEGARGRWHPDGSGWH